MTDRKNTKSKLKVENLELNRETVQDLTREEQEAAKGGLRAPGHSLFDSCYATDCCLATAQDPRTCAKMG